jgi:ABC-type Mn2+/Zn2+ transport system ATPase subunit
VDAATRQVVAEVLGALHLQGKTIIAATHELERLGTDFDNALYLVDGHEAHLDAPDDHYTDIRSAALDAPSHAVMTGEPYGLAD